MVQANSASRADAKVLATEIAIAATNTLRTGGDTVHPWRSTGATGTGATAGCTLYTIRCVGSSSTSATGTSMRHTCLGILGTRHFRSAERREGAGVESGFGP